MSKPVKLKLMGLIAISIISFWLIFWLYPHFWPLAGIKIESGHDDIAKVAKQIAIDLNLETEGYYTDIKIHQNRSLIRHLQENLGMAQSNKVLREDIPGYYYNIVWHSESEESSEENSDSNTNKIQEWKTSGSLDLKLNLKGKLIGLRHNIPDTVLLESINEDEAIAQIERFLEKFIDPNWIPLNMDDVDSSWNIRSTARSMVNYVHDDSTGQRFRIQTNNITDYQFSRDYVHPELEKPLLQKIIITGGRIKEITVDDQIKPKKNNTAEITAVIVLSIVIIIIIIMALIAGVKRLRNYEIGFKQAWILAGLVVIMTIINMVESSYHILRWELFITLFFASLFMGGGMLVLWAIAESLGREYWSHKFYSLDLLFKGYLRQSVIGQSLIKGIFTGLGLNLFILLLIGIVQYLLPISVLQVKDETMSAYSIVNPVLMLFVNHISVTLYSVAFIFLLSGALFIRYLPSTKVLGILIAVIYAVLNFLGIEPYSYGLLISLVIGYAAAMLFIHLDLLSFLLTMFISATTFNSMGMIYTEYSPLMTSAMIFWGIILLIIIFSVVTVWTRDKDIIANMTVPSYVQYIDERQRLKHQLEIARDVQMSFLPQTMPSVKGLDIAAKCIPAQEVGGDYYDFIDLGNERLGVAMGDVSGKGTQAAFYMTLTKGFLKAVASEFNRTTEVVARLNRLFYENARRNTFISMAYAIFDLRNQQMHISRAGHNPVLHYDARIRKVKILQPSGLALGLDNGLTFEKKIETTKVSLKKDDLFIFYTDGLTEARNKEGHEFGESALSDLVVKTKATDSDLIINEIFKNVKRFTGSTSQHDDMSVIVIRITS